MPSRTWTELQERLQRLRESQYRQGRLEWLLHNFCRRQLDTPLRAGELIDLREDVLAFGAAHRHGLEAVEVTQEELRALQDSVLQGIRSLFEGRAWELGSHTVNLGVDLDRDDPVGTAQPPRDAVQDGFAFRLWRPVKIHAYLRSPRGIAILFLREAAGVIESEWTRIHSCLWCGTFFLPVRRQRYCAATCTQQAMSMKKGRNKQPPRLKVSGLNRTWPMVSTAAPDVEGTRASAGRRKPTGRRSRVYQTG